MTNRELSQLRQLGCEIREEKRRLAAMEAAREGHERPEDGDLSALIKKQNELIKAKLGLAISEYNRIIAFVMTIDDSFIRRIMIHRYIDGMSWVKVAMTMGGGNTPDGVRKAHDRYLRSR